MPPSNNIRTILRETFIDEWMAVAGRPRPPFGQQPEQYLDAGSLREIRIIEHAADRILSTQQIEQFVRLDVLQSINPRVRERYHQANLRHIARLLAQKLYATSAGHRIDLETFESALEELKDDKASGCPVYPCKKQ